MLNPFNRKKKQQDNENSSQTEDIKQAKIDNPEENIKNKTLKNNVDKKRKELLGDSGINTEEIKREIIKALEEQKKTKKVNDPFKVRHDVTICLKDYDYSVIDRLPFQEITIKGEKFYLNYTYKDLKIQINHLFYQPQLEIDLAEEIRKKHATRRKLDDLNAFISEIQLRINRGEEDAEKIDLKDFIYQKEKLKSILETVNTGRKIYFKNQNPTTSRWEYEVIKTNDGWKWLRRDENAIVKPESSSKVTVGGNILEQITKILNLGVKNTYVGIVMAIAIFVALIIISVGVFHVSTFDERLINERVNEQLEQAVDLACAGYRSEADTLERFILNNGITPPRINNNPDLNDFEEVR